MDEDSWKAEYKIDPEFKDYINYVERARTKGDLSEKTFQKFQQLEGFYYWNQEEGILRYKTSIDGEMRVLIVVPFKFRERILIEYHDSLEGGHRQASTTLQQIKKKYYWPQMASDVKRYCHTCRHCLVVKTAKPKQHGKLKIFDVVPDKFDIVHVDFHYNYQGISPGS